MSFKMRPFKRVQNQGALEIPTLPAIVRDAFNRPLSVGDLVIVQTGRHDPFRVTKIAAVTEPNVPPNLMEIVVSVTLRFRAVRNQANQEFVRIMEFSETQQQTAPTDPQQTERNAEGVEAHTGSGDD